MTNAFEAVVAQVQARYELDLRSVVWIEHYEDDETAHAWDIATFKLSDKNAVASPAWRTMERDDWLELGLDPRL